MLWGTAGNDLLDGSSGIDTAVYTGNRSNFTLTKTATGYTIKDVTGAEGTDTLVNVERLVFADGNVALDTAGNAGQAWRLYKAAFDRSPDLPGLGYQMKALDSGLSLTEVAANFIASPEFKQKYSTPNNAEFVTLLYNNVLDRAPEASGLAYHVGRLSQGLARQDILVGFSESPENQANLVGVIGNGMDYVA